MSEVSEMGGNLREIAQALADSGRCADFWDVEMELLARGHSAADARRATGDEEMRLVLNQRCSNALRQRA
ncbi:MAG: hypothetical protein AB7G10_09145 [Reyranellaceae bacterium]